MKLITPQVWGEDAWRVMHVVALGFPESPTEADRKNYTEFYEALTNVLPCTRCREGYREIYARIPIRTDDTDALFQWTVDVHNAVNRKLGHDIMDARWIRNVYVFREHEKTGKPERKTAPGENSRALVAGAVILAVALVVAGGAWLRLSKGRVVK
jgi:hypothetical protein